MDEAEKNAPQALKDEVLRKVGRNLLLNQQIEHLLKSILGIARIEGTLADAGSRLEARQEELRTTSMGGLLKRFRDEVLTSPSEVRDEQNSPNTTHPWVSTRFQIEIAPENRAPLEADLALLARERNDLAHHFLPHWQPESFERMTETSVRLDEQLERIKAMHDRLKSILDTTREAGLSFATFLGSTEGRAAFELMWLQGSRLIDLLLEIAATPRRADGWTDLSYAAAIARGKEPDALADRKTRYGEESLKALVIKSQLFELAEEAVPGGVRTLIRVRREETS
ncbi:hypothetical protein ACIP1U_02975 [Cupriavidus sp. NPDC089707]|uniref:hypothetical protein n=1 Tax=Cupriavidus sp. NPDC089707 TaxID=3363963 RepID=UPI00382A0633